MKKTLFIFIAILLSGSGLRAQTLVNNYLFSTWVNQSMWLDITGQDSTLIEPPASGQLSEYDTRSLLTDIGFTFRFAGTDYTTFGTNVMGAVRFGSMATAITNIGYPVLQYSTPKVDALGIRGMMDSSCYMHYAALGTPGNRVLVMEARMGIYGHDSVYVSWQTQLFEANNEVRIVYGPSEGTTEMTATQPGLAKSGNDMLFLNFATNSVERYSTTPIPFNDVGVWPEWGRCYSFVPDSTICTPPSTVTTLNNDPDSTVLCWAGQGSTWRLRIPALDIDTFLVDTLLTLRGINPTTVYNGTIQAFCAMGDSSLHKPPFTFTTGCGTVHLLPWTDDFELNTSNNCWPKYYSTSYYGWKRVSSNSNYCMRAGYTNTYGNFNEWLISPPMELPATEGLTLSWLYKNEKRSNQVPQLRVLVLMCDTTDAVDTTDAWVTLGTFDEYNQTFQKRYRLLDAYAGHRVRVAFQLFGNRGKYAYIDDVSVEIRLQPDISFNPPIKIYAGDTTDVPLQLNSGVLSTPQYSWSSTMENRGQALILNADDTLEIVYLRSGIDTIIATISTDYGSDSASASVTVVDCRPVNYFPWHEGFENGLDCWEPQTGSSDWRTHVGYTHSGSNCLMSNTGSGHTNLIVSQPIVVPADAYMLYLGLWGELNANNTWTYSDIQILISNADSTDWSNATLLTTASVNVNYQYFEASLEAYAGQTVRFALRHSQANKIVYVDDITIRYTRVPIVSLATSSESSIEGDTVTATATLIEGDTVGGTYQWFSSMANNSQSDIIGSGPQVNIAYHNAGIDTIIVTYTNSYGTVSDTSTIMVCPSYVTPPLQVNFASDLPCWHLPEGSCSADTNGCLHFSSDIVVASPLINAPVAGSLVIEFEMSYIFFTGEMQVMVTADMNTFDTVGVIPFTSGVSPSTRIPINVSAGQQFHVVFKATGDFLSVILGNLSIRYSYEPVLALSVDDGYFPGTPVTLTATLLEGDFNNITYNWTSTMTQHGDATLVQNGGPNATLIPHIGGTDTVTVVVTNNYGSDTAIHTVYIMPCDTVETLPWVEEFVNHLSCWWQPEDSYWSIPVDSSLTMAVIIKQALTSDSWIISRAITLPSLPPLGGVGLQLQWDASSLYDHEHTYCIMVTTAADYRDLDNFDTLRAVTAWHPNIYDAGWDTMHADLSAYAGQTIRIAFRYTTFLHEPTGMPGLLIIDNVRITDSTATIPDTIWHTVTLQCDSTMGQVSGSGVYQDSTFVTISAAPYEGYHFTMWNDGDTAAVRNLLLISDTLFTAYFAHDSIPPAQDTVWRTVTVTCNNEALGSVDGSGIYADSSWVTISAIPAATPNMDSQIVFDQWGDGDTSNPRQIFVVSDTSFSATFLVVSDSVGISVAEESHILLTVHPNPTSDKITITTTRNISLAYLTDMLGHREEVHLTDLGPGQYTLDLTTRLQSTYLLTLITSEGQTQTVRVVKKQQSHN